MLTEHAVENHFDLQTPDCLTRLAGAAATAAVQVEVSRARSRLLPADYAFGCRSRSRSQPRTSGAATCEPHPGATAQYLPCPDSFGRRPRRSARIPLSINRCRSSTIVRTSKTVE